MGAMASPYQYRDGLARVGERYHYRFRWKGTIYQGSTGLTRRADAVEWLRLYRDNLAKGVVGMAPTPSVKRAFESWDETTRGKVSQAHRDRAGRAIRLHVLPVCGELPADQVTGAVVELIRTRYLDGESGRLRGGQRTQQGANVVLTYLKTILRHVLKELPFKVRPLKAQAPVRAYVPAERVPAFLAEIDRTGNQHVSVAVRAMLYLGLREAEALGMRWEWFHGDLATYTVGLAKGKEALPLPVHPDLRERLRGLKALSPYVLPADPTPEEIKARDFSPKPHRAQFTTKAVKRAGAAIGIPGLSPHRLRTTCATLMAKAGVSALHIQRQLRHKQISTTLRYVEVGLEDLQAAQARTFGA